MHEKVSTAITELNARLKEVYAEDFSALILYGSAAGNAYRADISDINVLVIIERNSADKVFQLGKAAKALLQKYQISPFFMTREELNSALDVFPLEFCDILDMHTVVHGEKKILDFKINPANLRHEMEEKLRGTVNDVHGMLLAAQGDEKLLSKYLANWTGVGYILFRGLLRLKGKSVTGLDGKTVLDTASKEYGVPLECISILNDLRYNKKPLTMSIYLFAEKILESLNALIKIVDAME